MRYSDTLSISLSSLQLHFEYQTPKMRARLYPFAGTDGEYIELLESIVVRFNERHSSYTGPPTDILPPITSANACSEPPRLPAACSLRKRKRKRSPERSHFIQWNPVESTTGSTEPPESRRNPVESTTRSAEPPESRWKKVARRLIKATPDATNWKAAIRKANLYGIIGTDNAASYLLDEGGAVSSSLVVNALEDGSLDLLDRVRRYATSTSERKASASTLVKLAVFQQFLLLSACVVLLDTGTIPQDAVMDIVKICIGEKSRTYCQRILNAVKYINCLLDNLNGHGWGHRAAELILLC